MKRLRLVIFVVPGIVFVLGLTSLMLREVPGGTPPQNIQPQNQTIRSAPIAMPPTKIQPLHTEALRSENESLTQEKTVTAQVFLVENIGTHEKIFERNAALVWPIASLTKVMTAIVAKEQFPKYQEITILEGVATSSETRGGLLPGEVFQSQDLITAMMVGSNNEAGESIARSDPSFDFVKAMNEYTQEMGMTHTAFADATGLSPKNVSTADDLREIMHYVYETHPEFLTMSNATSTTIYELDSGKEHLIQNINVFAGKPGFLGGKTGNIPESLGNFAGFFMKYGNPILIIVLGSNDRFKDVQILYDWVSTNSNL